MLVIIRGAPGSGKSTIARSVPNAVICEADDYFIDKHGNYEFNGALIKQAHMACYARVIKFLSLGKTVVVANTFTRLWELDNYISFCEDEGIEYKIFHATGNFNNIHGVPPEKVQRMRETYEPHPEEIDVAP